MSSVREIRETIASLLNVATEKKAIKYLKRINENEDAYIAERITKISEMINTIKNIIMTEIQTELSIFTRACIIETVENAIEEHAELLAIIKFSVRHIIYDKVEANVKKEITSKVVSWICYKMKKKSRETIESEIKAEIAGKIKMYAEIAIYETETIPDDKGYEPPKRIVLHTDGHFISVARSSISGLIRDISGLNTVDSSVKEQFLEDIAKYQEMCNGELIRHKEDFGDFIRKISHTVCYLKYA